jgi:lipoprotein NlpI
MSEAYNNRGNVYFAKGDNDRAIADYNQAISLAEKTGQVCEVNFYTGELSLLKGSKGEATRLFRLAASDCPHNYVGDAANAELKTLGMVP